MTSFHDTPRAPLTDETLDAMLSVARLDLSDERRQAAGQMTDLILGLVDTLDVLELGETPPAAAFDARWR